MLRQVFFALAVFSVAFATYGVDMSQAECGSVGESDWSCIAQNGINFAIIQAWDGGIGEGSNVAQCVSQAWNAGLAHVDIYVFMCPNCNGNNPPDQAIQSLYNSLQSQSVQYGMIWLDVEQCDGCWNDADSNCQFVVDMANAASNLGMSVGVYSSEYEWSATVGESCTSLSGYPLWYAHYDGDPSFDDGAYNFGGWSSPAMKQYQDTGPCVNVDSDWYPDSFLEYYNKTVLSRKK